MGVSVVVFECEGLPASIVHGEVNMSHDAAGATGVAPAGERHGVV